MIKPLSMRAGRILLFLTTTLVLVACGNAEADSEAIRHTVDTQFEEQDGDITVHLPESYSTNSDRTYPVVYIPAGRRLNSRTVRRVLDNMAEEGEAPEVIVVTSNAYYRALPPRDTTDSNGAAPEYLAHIRDELIPFIETEYRTSPERWINGFSSTGIFLVYTMVEAPDLFTGYIFQSPAFDNDWLAYTLAQLEKRFALADANPIRVYMGIGDRDTRNDRQAGFNAVKALVDASAPANVDWRSQSFTGKRHEEFVDLIREGIAHISHEE